MKPFGYSLHLDICTGDGKICSDVQYFYDFLVDLAKYLDMQTQAPPFIFRTPDSFPEKSGLTGFLPLVESGISIHTLDKYGFISLDIYTCGCLKMDTVIEWIQNKIPATNHIEKFFLSRGNLFPVWKNN